MTRLLRFTLVLCCMWTVPIFVAGRIGATQPTLPFFVAIFSNPDGSPCKQPCMFGVRPGIMSEDEALAILNAHPLTKAMKLLPFSYTHLEGPLFTVELGEVESGEKVRFITLTFNETPSGAVSAKSKDTIPVLGDMISYFGPPERALVSFSTTYDTYYLRKGVWARFIVSYQSRATPQELLMNITIYPGTDSAIAQDLGRRWRGFATFRLYQRAKDG
jgi:hypothetical protein